MAGWLANSCGEYLGGYPPTKEMIITKKEEFESFCDQLFFGDQYTPKKVQVFLVCSLVFYYDDMKKVIMECPNKKYENLRSHAMINEIFKALENINCVEDDLLKWSEELKDGYKKENFDHLPLKTLQRMEPNGSLTDILIDARSIFQVIKDIGVSVTNIAKRLIDFGWCMNECKHHMTNIIGSNNETIQLLKKQQQNMEIQNQFLKTQNELLQLQISHQNGLSESIINRMDKYEAEIKDLKQMLHQERQSNCSDVSNNNCHNMTILANENVDNDIDLTQTKTSSKKINDDIQVGFQKASKSISDMTWETNAVHNVVNELYQSKPNWEAVKQKLDETSNELLIYVWFDCKVQKTWNETKEKNKYRSTFSRKKTCVTTSLSFAKVNNIDVNFADRPEFGNELKLWQENVMKISKNIYDLVMKTAYRGKLFSDKESKNYMKGKEMSATNYQRIVTKVSKEYGNMNVTNNS